MQTTARNYFEKYSGSDAAAILCSLCNQNVKTFENDWLEFKSGRSQEKHVEEKWSKALGAFANNEGGVVIWGIDARKDEKGVDAAGKVVPVEDVNLFTTRLQEIARFATDPPLQGLEYKQVTLNAATCEGFVVCFIPEGTIKPYRSEKGQKKYYLRSGDESKEPTVSVLRQLFYPSKKCRARLFVTANPNAEQCSFHCRLVNEGGVSIESGEGLVVSPFRILVGQHLRLRALLHPSLYEDLNITVERTHQLDVQIEIAILLYQRDQGAMRTAFRYIPYRQMFIENNEPVRDLEKYLEPV